MFNCTRVQLSVHVNPSSRTWRALLLSPLCSDEITNVCAHLIQEQCVGTSYLVHGIESALCRGVERGLTVTTACVFSHVPPWPVPAAITAKG